MKSTNQLKRRFLPYFSASFLVVFTSLPLNAATIVYNGRTYAVSTRTGTYTDLQTTLAQQPWYNTGVTSTVYTTDNISSTSSLLSTNLTYTVPAPINRTDIITRPLALYSGADDLNPTGIRSEGVINSGYRVYYYFDIQPSRYDNDYVFVWLVSDGLLGPNAADTLASFQLNASALRNAFNLQSAKIAHRLSYDCTVYDQKNICVSFTGSKSDGKGFDATTGALIIAHKPTNNFRFGGYIDQSFGSDTSGGLTVKKGNPGFGAFAVWSQNADGSGVQVRASANMGKVDIETQREAIESAEAGFGKSNITSNGFQLEVSKDYAINSMWSARPYVGYRKTTNKRTGYTEQSADDVTAPLTYSSLKQTAETLTAGATFAHTLSAKTTLFLTAGIEHDLKNKIDRYAAANGDIGDIDSIDMSTNKTKTRPTVSFALNHDIDKTQRIGVSLTHRKEAFASGSTTSAQVQYSKGF